MEVTVLGCGTNIPNPQKAGPSFYVKDGKDSILLDMGNGSLRNIAKARIDRFKIKNIIFTHFHVDHFADLFPFLQNRDFTEMGGFGKTAKLNIFGPKGTKGYLKKVSSNIRSANQQLKKSSIKNLNKSLFKIGKFSVSTFPLFHGEKDVIGVRIEKNSKVFVYTGDTGICPNLFKLLKKADVAVCECAFSEKTSWEGHLNSSDLGEVAQKAGIKNLVLTHIYPFTSDTQVKKEVKENFKGKVILARDLLRIKI